MEKILLSLGSTIAISLLSFGGIIMCFLSEKQLKKFILYLVTLSASIMFATAFLHFLPEILETTNNEDLHKVCLRIIGGILVMFVVEKFIHWYHCYKQSLEHIQVFAKMNLLGDGIHNFIDGILIGATYLNSIPLGITTTIAILLHEIPQEISDYAVLIHGGFCRKNAFYANFICSLSAVLGTLLALGFGSVANDFAAILLPYGMGMFVYIAGSDLIPEINKHNYDLKAILAQICIFILGIVIVLFLQTFHNH